MDTKRTENCMICGEELAYLTVAIPVTCTYCGKQESANIHCPSGHYVCNECHASDSICEHSHRNKQCSYAECRYFEVKRSHAK